MIQPDSNGIYHPANTGEVKDLLVTAQSKLGNVRVRGSMHSVQGTWEADGKANVFNVMLDNMRNFLWVDQAAGIFRVEAGCNLGVDPYDPKSTPENSLCQKLYDAGWALPDLGGITHQTVAGFLATGSSGGSLIHSLSPQILEIAFFDALGNFHTATPGSSPDLFSAMGVSLGLIGVVVWVEMQAVKRFCIQGQEAITSYDDCEIDLFGAGDAKRPSLKDFLYNRNSGNPSQQLDAEYSRLIWWPQKGVEKVTVWKAKRVPWSANFKPKPYVEFAFGGAAEMSPQEEAELWELLGLAFASCLAHKSQLLALAEKLRKETTEQDLLAKLISALTNDDVKGLVDAIKQFLENLEGEGLQALAGLFYALLGSRHVANSLASEMFTEIFTDEASFDSQWFPLLLNKVFVVSDNDKTGEDKGQPQRFQDYSYRGLPMDNGVDDQLMGTQFTELWIPIGQTQKVMNVLKDFYEQGGMKATGTFCCEIYGTKAEPFWLSPAYQTDVVRIDIFWYKRNHDLPFDFYAQFWNLLKPFDFRFHWGKFMSKPNSPTGLNYLKSGYPEWDSFLGTRLRYDPLNIFVNDYWREQLGI